MNEKLEYTIIWSNCDDKLTTKVNKMMKEGWLPQGGISVIKTGEGKDYGGTCSNFLYHQAMIKKEVNFEP